MNNKEQPWQAHYPEGLDFNTEYHSQPVGALLENAASRFPDHIALDFLGATISYAELSQRVDKAAAGLQKLGVKQGVKVGLLLPNCPQCVVSYYAILKAGGTVVNFSPLYSRSEIEHQLKDSDCEVMITLNLEVLYPNIRPFLGQYKLRHIIVGTLTEALPTFKALLFTFFKRKELATLRWDENHSSFVTLLENDPLTKQVHIEPDKWVAVIQYTGGTTGTPKGAMLSHDNIQINARQAADWCQIDPEGEGITLAALPFFHVFAMTVCMNMSLHLGSRIVMLPRFELKKVLKAIQTSRPTIMPGVPAMFNAILHAKASKKYDLKSIKACVSGGAPLPKQVKADFEALTGCVVVEGYGLTEASPVTHCNPVNGLNKTGSIGLPFPNTMTDIESQEVPGTFVKQGEIGQLCVTGPQVMLGYYKQESETSNVLEMLKDGSRRLRTGDLARIDDEGYVEIVDRLKEMIIVSGFKVYPRNVEEALYTHDDVLEAAVLGKKDTHSGEAVCAYIVLKEGSGLALSMLHSYLATRIGKHELPKHYYQCKELPKTMIGKISKKDMENAELLEEWSV